MRWPWLSLPVLLLGFSAGAQADNITYTEQVIGDGSLGVNTFERTSITIVLNGNTAKILSIGGGIFVDLGIATVTVAGIGTGTFTDKGQMFVFDNQTVGEVGISDARSADVLDTFDPAFVSYALASSIGPITNTQAGNLGLRFPTTVGDFTLEGFGNTTFTAAAAVPEPESLGLLGIGLVGFMTVLSRLKRLT
jgi:hypothetical protein